MTSFNNSQTETSTTLIKDPEEFRKLVAARNNFLNFVGHDNIINIIKSIIKDSSSFSFRSE